ncbi:MAG: hypothetical protein RLY71_2875 [Pseudomonadota bacterium]|jgi:long-chain fatty acid transport protein
MFKFNRAPVAGAALLCALAMPAAHATNGYFSHGYGLQAKGMGGAAIAVTQDAFGGANNPAGGAWVGSRLDLGIDWFSPQRSASRTGSNLPTPGGTVAAGADFSTASDSTSFFIPEFGYNRMLGSDKSVGLTVYGNGGMNTDYAGGTTMCGNALCGQGRLGVDLAQLIVAPTFSMKLDADHSVGVALLLGYQRFKVEGLQAFEALTGSPGSVTNNGYDSSTGVGLRLGYLGRVGTDLQFGASYTPKMHMSKFDKYKGLFAEQGGFDIPAHYAVGLAWRPASDWQLALDLERIQYRGIASVGNPSSNQAPLGADNGPGFGWQDISVVKVGVQWRMSPALTLRAGYNHGGNPVKADNVTFNIIAPGVVQNHVTLGGTLAIGPGSDLTLACMHAMKQSVSGSSMYNSPSLFGPGNGGTETIQMHQNSLGIGWSLRF